MWAADRRPFLGGGEEVTLERLVANEQIVLAANRSGSKDAIDAQIVTSWRDGRLVFDNDPLSRVVAEVNRYSARKVVLGDPSLAEMRVSGTSWIADGFANLQAAFPVSVQTDDERNHLILNWNIRLREQCSAHQRQAFPTVAQFSLRQHAPRASYAHEPGNPGRGRSLKRKRMHTGISTSLQAAMLVGAAQIAIAAPLHARTSGQFRHPAQELSKSLREFAATTDMDLLYPPQLVENRRARAVKGAMTPAALREMLRGSGLAFDVNGDDAVTLRAVGASRNQAERGDEDAANSMVATAPLSGIVRNAATGSVLPGANVRIAGTPLRTVTDDRGQYNFPAAPQGTQTVVVEYLGQVPQVASVSVAPGVRNTGDVSVGSSSDEIVVLGYRSAIQVALNQQKNADNNSTVVASDLLGGFPAETVSEALRRVPGVAVGRDADTREGSRITVRGFSSEAINVQLNGLDLQGTGYERMIDLSGFLADNISQVTVHKSLLPSHESPAQAGWSRSRPNRASITATSPST